MPPDQDTPDNKRKQENRDVWRMLGNYLSLAVLLPVSAVVGYAMGFYLDEWLGTTYLRVVFLLFGIASGLIELIRRLAKDIGSDGR